MPAPHNLVDWLSLIEVSGPFLSQPVLARALPQGLDERDADQAHDLRRAYEHWDENQGGRRPDPAVHSAWIRYVLREALALPDELLVERQALPASLSLSVPEQGETLRPDLALLQPEGRANAGAARLLLATYPSEQGLDRPKTGSRWAASPASRMADLLRATGVRLGLVTNGEQWMLVNAPRAETTGFASWYANLWFEEPVTLRAFTTFLGARRFFGVSDDETLEALLAESAADQAEVTDQLGQQVRRAVEMLVQALDRADKDRQRTLLRDIPEARLYEAALAVMMRLVFLMSAEERGLLLLGEDRYDQFYAVATLGEQLRAEADRAGEEVLERRFDAWSRVLATFRIVHAGVQHEALRLPAYGGHLFDPDRYPFLEGRQRDTSWRDTPAQPLPIHNRTVLHLLDALQYLRLKGAGTVERRRLSFRALDVEQIGHVYETLLEQTALRATEPLIGLVGTAGEEPKLPLAALEAERARGEDALIAFLKDKNRTGRSESALRRGLAASLDAHAAGRLLTVCDNDESLRERILPYAGLLAADDNEYPLVVTAGSVYVGAGADRRSTQTHYTPRSLTEPIVKYTLEPLVYEGPAEGWNADDWRLRGPRDLLALKVCDPAMGSGAFLVQACRYLSERLVEAWGTVERRLRTAAGGAPIPITVEGEPASGAPGELLVPIDAEERLTVARRLIADRCLYGVDKNPMAVEMAKLSLWLTTLAKGRPFTFLDHALRAGDSLLGLASVEQVTAFHLDPRRGREARHDLFRLMPKLEAALSKAVTLRVELEREPVVDVEVSQLKEMLNDEARDLLADLRLAGDLVCGAALVTAGRSEDEFDGELTGLAFRLARMLDDTTPPAERDDLRGELRAESSGLLNRLRRADQAERTTFHWPLEFPEVFLAAAKPAPGFDAIVGNPPFLGGKKISGPLGTDYREYLVEHIADDAKGNADICSYFFLRASALLRRRGMFGLLATNTIAQGDTREVGLDHLLADGCTITRALPSRKWPGVANLEIAEVWLCKGGWQGARLLDDDEADSITAYLTAPGATSGNPQRLTENAGLSFIGSYVLGLGFVLEPEQAQALIAKDARNRDVLFPYLNGEDLNARPDQSPSRWVINFHDWDLERAESYPDCMSIARADVKPERQRRRDDGSFVLRSPLPQKWWIYADKRPALYATIAGMERVLVRSLVSDSHALAFVPYGYVYSHALGAFAFERDAAFALLQSNLHEAWALARGSTLETRFRYTPSDCFETFPFPKVGGPNDGGLPETLDAVGEEYHEQRRQLMRERWIGLTAAYNLFNSPKCSDADIQRMRDLHRELDTAVAEAYGWNDIDLDHDFREFRGKVRYTIGPQARRTILDRLLALNHERYVEEVKKGLHEKGVKKKGKAGVKRLAAAQGALL